MCESFLFFAFYMIGTFYFYLASDVPILQLFYEQKAALNVSLDNCKRLWLGPSIALRYEIGGLAV